MMYKISQWSSGILPPKFPLREGPFYGPDGATCGISEYYPTLQTVLHLVPVSTLSQLTFM